MNNNGIAQEKVFQVIGQQQIQIIAMSDQIQSLLEKIAVLEKNKEE